MSQFAKCPTRRFFGFLTTAVVLLAGAVSAQVVTPTPGEKLQLQPKPPERWTVDMELERLADKAPVVTTLQARYRLDSVSTVEGVDTVFSEAGRLYFDHGDLAVYRELTPQVDDMQLLYRSGELLRYFPVAGYGHRVVTGSFDKDHTDFARFWRPLLAHLEPGTVITKTAGVAEVETLSTTSAKLEYQPDRAAEIAGLPASNKLEYWGPRPDVTFISDSNSRVEQVERTLFRVSKLNPTQAQVEAHSVARLEQPIVFGGVLIPTRIVYEITLDGQTAPYRTSTIELVDVVVGGQLPASAFTPVWPSDAFLLDVEPRAPESYLATSDDPRSQIRLADAYLGRGMNTEAEAWIATFRQSFAGRPPSPAEVGHLARLLTLAGHADEARSAHLDSIRQAREAVSAGGSESELVRYFGEYAYFMAYHVGRRMHDEAGRFLEGKLGELTLPMAIAELAGRASHHFVLDRRYDLAEDVLARAESRLGGGQVKALALIEACRERIGRRQQQNSQMQLVFEKKRKIRDLKARLDELSALKLATPSAEAELIQIEEQLERLETLP